MLGQHPSIVRPFRKEMGYFLFNRHKGLKWYLRAYGDVGAGQRCIDVTPEYFFSPEAAAAIDDFGPLVRVIIGVRDPVTFATSLHAEYGKRFNVPPIERFVQHYSYRRGSETIEMTLASGTIRKMLALYRQTFGARLLLYDFAAFATDPLPVLQAIERFAAIAPTFSRQTFTNVAMNRGDRWNARWVSAMLSAEPLIDAASRILPASLLRRLALNVYGHGRSRPSGPSTVPPSSPLLDSVFAQDREFIARLFNGRPVVNGAGETV